MRKELIGMSKFLSLVLRHAPETIGLQLDSEGWADVNELISKAEIYQKTEKFEPLTQKLLDEIVATNEKKRFAYSDDGWRIRASQGHSVDVDLKLKPTVPPKYLYHGTVEANLHSISINGLKKMSRNHVHLSADKSTAEKVGLRHAHGYKNKLRVLRVNAEDMNKDGYDCYLSANGVWLTDNIPSKYIEIDWK